MTWLALALVTAFAEATKDLVSKRTMLTARSGFVAWALSAFSAPLLWAAALATGVESPEPQFYPAVGVTIALFIVAVLLYMKAIQASDLSLTLPMVSFTPAFMLVTGPLVLGEQPEPRGLVGVVTIVLGAYLLNIKDARQGLLRPIAALAREPGPRYMLAVALIFSITATTAKVAIEASTPLTSMATLHSGSALVLTVVMLARRTITVETLRRHWRGALLIGLLVALAETCLAYAISLTLAVYAVSIKRLSILIGALLGFVVFKEKNLGPRLLGAAVMVAGLVLIALADR